MFSYSSKFETHSCATQNTPYLFWISIKQYLFFFGIDTLPLRPRQEHSNFLKLSFKQGILEIVFTHTHLPNLTPGQHRLSRIWSWNRSHLFNSHFTSRLIRIRSLCSSIFYVLHASDCCLLFWIEWVPKQLLPILRSPRWVWAVHNTFRIAMARCHGCSAHRRPLWSKPEYDGKITDHSGDPALYCSVMHYNIL